LNDRNGGWVGYDREIRRWRYRERYVESVSDRSA